MNDVDEMKKCGWVDERWTPPSVPRNELEVECDKLVGHISTWSKPNPVHGRAGGIMTFDTDRSPHRGRYHVQSYYEDGTYAGGSDSFEAETLCERLDPHHPYHRVIEGSMTADNLLEVYQNTIKMRNEESIAKLIESFSAKIANPQGECFDASMALGILLAKQGLPTRLMKGKRGDIKHWWLQCGDRIIDPTAHQFDGVGGYVVDEIHSISFDSIVGYLEIEDEYN